MNGISQKIPKGLKGPSHKVSEGTTRNIFTHSSLMKNEKAALTLCAYKFYFLFRKTCEKYLSWAQILEDHLSDAIKQKF